MLSLNDAPNYSRYTILPTYMYIHSGHKVAPHNAVLRGASFRALSVKSVSFAIKAMHSFGKHRKSKISRMGK